MVSLGRGAGYRHVAAGRRTDAFRRCEDSGFLHLKESRMMEWRRYIDRAAREAGNCLMPLEAGCLAHSRGFHHTGNCLRGPWCNVMHARRVSRRSSGRLRRLAAGTAHEFSAETWTPHRDADYKTPRGCEGASRIRISRSPDALNKNRRRASAILDLLRPRTHIDLPALTTAPMISPSESGIPILNKGEACARCKVSEPPRRRLSTAAH